MLNFSDYYDVTFLESCYSKDVNSFRYINKSVSCFQVRFKLKKKLKPKVV